MVSELDSVTRALLNSSPDIGIFATFLSKTHDSYNALSGRLTPNLCCSRG